MNAYELVGNCEKCQGLCLVDWEEDWMEGRFLPVHWCVNCGWRTPLFKDRRMVAHIG